MALTYEEARGVVPSRSPIACHWITSVQAACDTLSHVPHDLMDSITVTGRLEGRREEMDLLTELSCELARQCGLQVSIESRAEGFTARFSRKSAE